MSQPVIDRAAPRLRVRDVRAAAELQLLVTSHRDSKYANRHILALAELYEELSEEYVDAHPPESLHFDPVRFQDVAHTIGDRLAEADPDHAESYRANATAAGAVSSSATRSYARIAAS